MVVTRIREWEVKQEESKLSLRNWLESELEGHVRYQAKARRDHITHG